MGATSAPTIAPGIDVADYTARLTRRFDNTALNHRCTQIATDASLKVPQRLIAPLRDLEATGRPAPLLCFALATWIRSCQGSDEAGRPMPMSDPQLAAWSGLPGPDVPPEQSVRAFLGCQPVFGPGLNDGAAASITSALTDIRSLGVQGAARLRLTS